MKKHALTIALASALMLPSAFATAATGKIQFDGKVTNETCSLASKSSNIVVTMGTWSTNFFTAPNTYSELADFEITLTGCDKDGVAHFTFTGTPDNADGTLLRLNNAGVTGTAKNIAVGVTTGSDAATAANRVKFDGSETVDFNFVKGNNTLYLKAFYESTAATVEPGEAKANATFVVTYA